MSTSTEYMDGLNASAERRFYPRVTPPTAVLVAFGSNNLGVLHNVSENGFQVVTPSELALNSVYRIFLSLNGAPKTIAVTVRTIWTVSAENRSGIQLLDLADEDRQQIRKWVEFEMSRSEHSTPWFLPKNGDHQRSDPKPMDRPAMPPAGPQRTSGAAPMPTPAPNNDTAFSLNSPAAFASSPAPAQPEVLKNAPPAGPAMNANPNPAAAPRATVPPAPAPTLADAQPAAVNDNALPKIANPFEEPDPNSHFTSPFPSVPLPIHGEFEYAGPPPKVHRRSTWSSQLRTRPLLLWAAALALVCLGANALVRYKIKQNSQHFASESAKYTPPKSDAAPPDSSTSIDDSGANASAPSATDSQSAAISNADANSKSQTSSPTASAAATPTATRPATTDSSSASTKSPSRSTDSAQTAPRRESSLDARDNRPYSATAPPASDSSEQAPRSSQATTTPRSWTAPAPNQASSTTSASVAPQSPNVTNSSAAALSQSAPIVSQTRPTPPPAPPVQASNPPPASTPTSNSNATNTASNNSAARTQQPPNSQAYASQPRPQSQIYNANAPAQRSAVMGSINSVHSSGIFDSNDSASASTSAPPSAARASNTSNAGGNAASRGISNNSVSNSSVVATDTPQERDLEIVAPKGLTASYVDLPGEHLVRAPGAAIRIRRLVRVPGERIPGQRWLWRGRLNVTLGDVMNRIDPAVIQASGASGSLSVQATIDKDGYVTDVKPLYGNFAMLPSVSRAVRNWRYEPTYLDSKRAETQAQIDITLAPNAASNRAAHP